MHSSSSSECEEGKQYYEKTQFSHSIIQDIYRLRTYVVEFLKRQKRNWSSSEQGGPKATLMDLIYIKEKEGVEQQYVEGQVLAQKDAKEGEIHEVGVQPPRKV